MNVELRHTMKTLKSGGLSYAQIAERCGVHLRLVKQYLNESPVAKKAQQLRAEGYGVPEIAQQLGIAYKLASVWTAGFAPEGWRSKYQQAHRETVRAYRDRGLSERAISSATGIPRSTVRELLRDP